ncbi:MAG TPA: type II secretion system F family protein [Candidatus Bathyarchaeia archaeon]|nr:type II secretion system F family protein [Candidatus Bathyarchaeia archaeon]
MQESIIGIILSVIVGFSLAVLFLPKKLVHQVQVGDGQHTVIRQLRQQRTTLFHGLEGRLARANIGITAIHYLLISVTSGSIAFLLCAFVLKSWWLATPALLAGVLLTERVIHLLAIRKKERFEQGNVKAIRIMASALRTSPSYLHAFEEAAESPFVDKEVAGEYQRVVKLLRGQVPIERVLGEFHQRSHSDDIAYLATIIQVQRELGGDMGKTMELAALSILRRKQMQRRQRAVMSQLLAQVNLLSVMPYVFVVSLYFNNPHHFDPLTATLSGRLTMLGALAMILVGGEVIRHMALQKKK